MTRMFCILMKALFRNATRKTFTETNIWSCYTLVMQCKLHSNNNNDTPITYHLCIINAFCTWNVNKREMKVRLSEDISNEARMRESECDEMVTPLIKHCGYNYGILRLLHTYNHLVMLLRCIFILMDLISFMLCNPFALLSLFLSHLNWEMSEYAAGMSRST